MVVAQDKEDNLTRRGQSRSGRNQVGYARERFYQGPEGREDTGDDLPA